MKVLFVTSEHPKNTWGGLGTFTREFTKVLRRYCSVVVVYFHFDNDEPPSPDSTIDYVLVPEKKFKAFAPEAQVLEAAASLRSQLQPIMNIFNPDVIHCNDRQTFLPFRFDKNVLYSSHLLFCDLLSMQGLDDIYFQELKIEKSALQNSCLSVFYSEFAQKRASKLVAGNFHPVILPLGFNPDKFKNSLLNTKEKINVGYFGRFENVQKGFMNFINSVNLLGKEFKEKNNVEYFLYGRGEISNSVDLSLFNPPEFLSGEDLYQAYSKMDIVVMPSRYEPFGLTGLEAMASGCLLLATSGLGMDSYMDVGKNCLAIPQNPEGVSLVLKDAILNIEKHKPLRECALESVKKITWDRCVKSHFYFYSQISQKRFLNLKIAYRPELYNFISKIKNSSLLKKENEKSEFQYLMNLLNKLQKENQFENKRCLLISNFVKGEKVTENFLNCDCINLLEKSENGILYRSECLPFVEKFYDYVIAINYFETCLNFDLAISELFRIAREKIFLFVNHNKKNNLQTYFIEDKKEVLEEIEKSVNYIFDSKIENQNDDFGLISFENIKSKENFNNKCMAN